MSRGAIRLAYWLLGLMSLVSFVGPFVFGGVLKGGWSAGWPPDRPIEWVVLGVMIVMVVGVLVGLSVLWLLNMKHLQATRAQLQAAREAKAHTSAEAERGAL